MLDNFTAKYLLFILLLSLSFAEAYNPRHLSTVEAVNELFARGRDDYIIYERYPEAIACFDEAISLDPEYLPSYVHKLNAVLRSGNAKGATDFLNTVLKLKETSASLYYLAVLLDSNRQKAPKWLEVAETMYQDDSIEETLFRALALLAMRTPSEAFACYEKAIKLDPNYAPIYLEKASVLYSTGKLSEALAILTKAIELNPEYAAAYALRGMTLMNLKRLSEALTDYDKAEELGTTCAFNYFNKGFILDALDRKLEAIESFDKSLSYDKNFASSYRNKGATLVNLGRSEEAIECLDKAIALDPSHAFVYRNKAIALSDLNRLPEAIELFQKARKMSPSDIILLLNMGSTLMVAKRFPEAVECFDKVIKLRPDNKMAQKNKALALALMNDEYPNPRVSVQRQPEQDL